MDDLAKKLIEKIDENAAKPKVITKKRYEHLKQFSNLNDDEQKEVNEYEENEKRTKRLNAAYFNKINERSNNFKVSTPALKKAFLNRFKTLHCVEFENKGFEDVAALIYYFAKDERFFECQNLRGDLSKPSFKKGLLIVGNYGSGKSAAMHTIQSLFNNTPLEFSKYSTNKIVDRFESFNDPEARGLYLGRLKTKPAYFDDVKTEKDANAYGKHNLLKTIIEERELQGENLLTFISCNFREGGETVQDVEDALAEFSERYGPRVYDRLFKMFNIIQFNGKTYRR